MNECLKEISHNYNYYLFEYIINNTKEFSADHLLCASKIGCLDTVRKLIEEHNIDPNINLNWNEVV
jgi:hypothetical protein